MLMQDVPLGSPSFGERRLRRCAAAALHAASRLLDGLATRLVLRGPSPATDPVLEFHGDAGAPEGALYVDGRLVGHVLGVTRL